MENCKEMIEEKSKQKEKEKETLKLDMAVNKFVQKFVGLTTYIFKKMARITKDKNRRNKHEEISKLVLFISQGFQGIIVLLFFLFTILSLASLCPTQSTFIMNLTIQRAFYSGDTNYLILNNLLGDILTKISPLFHTTLSANITVEDIIINGIRITIFKTQEFPCPPVVQKNFPDEICYYPTYNINTENMNLSLDAYNYLTNQICIFLYNLY
jgi:hypothetical protein